MRSSLEGAAQPALSVLMATHNGATILRYVLDGYTRQIDAPPGWTLTIVDNNSSDRTPDLVREYATRLPIRLISQPLPGKNKALNTALTTLSLTDELVVLTDDDAIPHPRFLAEWAKVSRDRPNDEIYGGRVTPRFHTESMDECEGFRAHFGEIYASNERPSGPIGPRDIFGPNMAVRGTVLRDGIRFNEDIGPNSSQSRYPMGSETEFCVRAASELGLKAYFVREAAVEHIVRDFQTRTPFILARAYRHGRGVALQHELKQGRPFSMRQVLKSRLSDLKNEVARSQKPEALWQAQWQKGYSDYVKGSYSAARKGS